MLVNGSSALASNSVGRSASIILNDADLEAAVSASVASAMLNSGQTSSTWTRLLVPHSSCESALSIAGVCAGSMVLGDPLDRHTQLGLVISARHRASIGDALARGPRLITGGSERISERGHL